MIEDVDRSNLICALGNRGITFLDASSPLLSLPGAAPLFAAPPALSPSSGPNIGRYLNNAHRFELWPATRRCASATRIQWPLW